MQVDFIDSVEEEIKTNGAASLRFEETVEYCWKKRRYRFKLIKRKESQN